MQGTVLIGADVLKQNPANDTDVNKFFSSQIAGSQIQPYDALEITCQHVNCTYSGKVGDGSSIPDDQKLFGQGPIRKTYRFQEMTDDYFSDNFVSSTRYTKSFEFREVGCVDIPPEPTESTVTPTSALRACNESCTSDEQCTAGVGNEGRYCMTNYVSYWWNTLVDDFNQDDGLPAGARITGINNRLSSNGQKYEQHVIAGNKIYYRERQRGATGWTGIPLRKTLGDNPTDINTYIDDVGCAALGKTTTDSCNAFKNEFKIVDFNSYHYTKNGSNYTQQHLIRSNGSKGYVFAVNNEGGWKAESA